MVGARKDWGSCLEEKKFGEQPPFLGCFSGVLSRVGAGFGEEKTMGTTAWINPF
jgi:hypothetical protein